MAGFGRDYGVVAGEARAESGSVDHAPGAIGHQAGRAVARPHLTVHRHASLVFTAILAILRPKDRRGWYGRDLAIGRRRVEHLRRRIILRLDDNHARRWRIVIRRRRTPVLTVARPETSRTEPSRTEPNAAARIMTQPPGLLAKRGNLPSVTLAVDHGEFMLALL